MLISTGYEQQLNVLLKQADGLDDKSVNSQLKQYVARRIGKQMSREKFFPDIINNLPQADIPIEGVTSCLLQGKHQQVVFMSYDKDVLIPEHSHDEQWGVALDGESGLTIGGQLHVLKKGDTYFIPRAFHITSN